MTQRARGALRQVLDIFRLGPFKRSETRSAGVLRESAKGRNLHENVLRLLLSGQAAVREQGRRVRGVRHYAGRSETGRDARAQARCNDRAADLHRRPGDRRFRRSRPARSRREARRAAGSRMSRIAVLQMTSGIQPERNIAVILEAIGEAREGGAEMLFTPEMSLLLDRD